MAPGSLAAKPVDETVRNAESAKFPLPPKKKNRMREKVNCAAVIKINRIHLTLRTNYSRNLVYTS